MGAIMDEWDRPLRWSLRPLDATELEEIDVYLDVLDDAGQQAPEADERDEPDLGEPPR